MIEFILGSSLLFKIFFMGLFFILLSVITLIKCSIWLKIILGFSVFKMVKHYVNLHENSERIHRLWQDGQGLWYCQNNHKRFQGTILNDSFVCFAFIILRFRATHRTLNILIPRDSLSLEDYKRMRLTLLIESGKRT